tara:strand:+ start:708 stop:1136 length:429 start_codon:yes stop_codon:yes gene_type:complete
LNNAIEISPYDANDESEVIALWNACGLVTHTNDPRKDINRKLEVDRNLFLVGRNQNAVVATVMGGYEGHRGWINYLAVAPLERRKGYGQKMMAAVEGLIGKKGCPKINLQVRAANEDVIEFYKALGYRVDDVIGLGERLKVD